MTKQRIRAIATDSLELPAEIAFQTAKLVLVGNHMLKAINHRGTPSAAASCSMKRSRSAFVPKAGWSKSVAAS